MKCQGDEMDNLIFSLNATAPIFLLMVLGMLFRKIGWIDEEFASKMNKFVFLVPLPVLVFEDLATVDFVEVWDLRFVLFCFLATLLSIGIVFCGSFFLKNRSIQGEFIQSSYRSSAALLGIALIQNIYGKAGMGPLMIIGSVPLYNVMAVIVLSFFSPERGQMDKQLVVKTLKGILKNPIIIGILAGIIWSATGISMPVIVENTISKIGSTATPLGLMAMGANFQFQKAFAYVKPTIVASVLKLIGFAAIFLPIAVWFGFREEELVAILIMLSSATTVSCFVMAKNMGHEGVLTSSVVMVTTLFSAFTVTGWIYILRSLALI